MFSILELTKILGGVMTAVQLRQFGDIIQAFLCVSTRTTTRSLARYTDCSERTLFRLLKGEFNWALIRCRLFAAFCFDASATYILAIDETVEGKSRSKTFGLGRFYSSILQKPIAGICFFGVSLVNTKTATAYFLGAEQVAYTAEEKARITATKNAKKSKKTAAKPTEAAPKGRPKGTKNKPKEENQTASFRVFKSLITNVLESLLLQCVGICLQYVVADSAYGTKHYSDYTLGLGLHLVSKFKSNAALYLPFSGPKTKYKPCLYGVKLDMDKLPMAFLKEEISADGCKAQIFQFKAFAKNTFGAQLLNIVVVRTVHLESKKVSIQIWFCTDLHLDYLTLLNHYHLRFQIEFDFRDAKQHFGLSDFKNYKERNLTNFVNLAFTMCLVAKIYQAHLRKKLAIPKLSISDIKTIFKARFTAKNILKLVQKDPNLIFNTQFCNDFVPNDLINAA